MDNERLDKILSKSGYGSRSEARALIRSGAAAVNGESVCDPGAKFDAGAARISVYGAPIGYREYIYIMLNKPKGVVSSTDDPRHAPVVALLPPEYRSRGPFPVGRLDIDATGLLLLTDDGGLAHRLLSPNKHIEKEYEVTLDRRPGAPEIDGFERGLELGGGLGLKPAKLILCDGCAARVIITEGKFHQIKRMFGAFGIKVLDLKRLRMGPLALDPALAPGEFRELTAEETAALN